MINQISHFLNYTKHRPLLKITFNYPRFSSKEYNEPEDMSAFYRAVKNKINKIKEEEDPNPLKLRKIWNLKNTIAWTFASLVLYSKGTIIIILDYFMFSGLFFIGALRNLIIESRINMMFNIIADQYFSQIKNKKIFFGYE